MKRKVGRPRIPVPKKLEKRIKSLYEKTRNTRSVAHELSMPYQRVLVICRRLSLTRSLKPLDNVKAKKKTELANDRRKIKRKINSLPDLRKTSYRLTDTTGRLWPLYCLKEYYIAINKRTNDVVIEGWLRPNGSKKVMLSLPKNTLEEWFRENNV